jgi:hypothetical protein
MTERGFSVRLLSKEYVLNVSMSEKGGEGVLFEGVLGELEGLEVIEDAVLLITGTKGTLMVDLSEEELRARARSGKRENKRDTIEQENWSKPRDHQQKPRNTKRTINLVKEYRIGHHRIIESNFDRLSVTFENIGG